MLNASFNRARIVDDQILPGVIIMVKIIAMAFQTDSSESLPPSQLPFLGAREISHDRW